MGLLTRETIDLPIPMSSAQIIADLSARIASGEYPPGTKLPTHRDLASLYSVSTSTAERIYDALKAGGLVVGRQGDAMYVAEAGSPRS